MRRSYAATNENRAMKNFSAYFIRHNCSLTATYETNSEVNPNCATTSAALRTKRLTAPFTDLNSS